MGLSSKTTLAGVGAILSAAGLAVSSYASTGTVDWSTLVPAVLAGIGLIVAKDHTPEVK